MFKLAKRIASFFRKVFTAAFCPSTLDSLSKSYYASSSDWAKLLGVHTTTVRRRMRRGGVEAVIAESEIRRGRKTHLYKIGDLRKVAGEPENATDDQLFEAARILK